MLSPLKKFWAQKVLPTVYDDALSYYEVLGKIGNKINEVVDTLNDISTFIENLQTTLDGKADKVNTVLTGSVSANRKADTEIGVNSVAMGGLDVEATGYASYAEGAYSRARGHTSHAEGSECDADGDFSHAEGKMNKAIGECQHVEGKYNVFDEDGVYAHIIGNGAGHLARSNAFTVDWNGNGWFAGDVKVGGESYDDENANTLATQGYVDASLNGYATETYVTNAIGTATTGLASETYVDTSVGTKANKNNPVFTGSTATFAGNVFANNDKQLATQEYVNDAVSGATGVTIGSGTFTANGFTYTGYFNSKQYGSIVFFQAYIALSNGAKFGDLSASKLGEISGIGTPNTIAIFNAYTSDGTDYHYANVGMYGSNSNTIVTMNHCESNDALLILNGCYFTA